MEYEKIKQLMEDMEIYKLNELKIEFPEGLKISMKKEGNEKIKEGMQCNNTDKNIQNSIKKEETKEKVETGNVVKSPMVGTFYLKPSPNSDPYVQEGKEVKKGDTLCIIEAMKLMNEIESEYTGVIKKILVKDGQPVEYGTELFIID